MRFWIASDNTAEFYYADEEDGELCEKCLSEDISGKCHLNRYATRKSRENRNYIYCFDEKVPAKQAKFLARIATDFFPKLTKAAEKKNQDISDIQTIAYHNAKKLNASIGQKIDTIYDSQNQQINSDIVQKIKEVMQQKPDNIASEILSVRKIVEQVESEYNLVEILADETVFNPEDLTRIRAHSLVMGVFHNYKTLLSKRHVRVRIDQTDQMLDVDYGVAKSSIGQILSNAAKYCQPHSTVEVSVRKNEDFVELIFGMTSLYFSKRDSEKMRHIHFRSPNASRFSGEGIGLFAVNLFQKKHSGYLHFSSDEDTRFSYGGDEYSRNQFVLGFADYGLQ